MRPVERGGQPIRWQLKNPLAVDDQAVLFPDGWAALAFAEPYHVDWVNPTGQRIRGATITLDRVRIDDRMKRALIAYEWPKVKPPFEPTEVPPWPEFLPGFQTKALVAAPDGRLLVRRTYNPLVAKIVYDLIDRRGTVTGRLELEVNQRIVGFGARSVYVVEKDADDVEWVQRRPWP
jgi:hypothetical protein